MADVCEEKIIIMENDLPPILEPEAPTLDIPNSTRILRSATKRRHPKFEVPVVKHANLDSVSFVKSADDTVAVDIISRNMEEFSTICASYGLKLSIECMGNNSGIDVRLIQVSSFCQTRLAVQEMGYLLQIKKHKLQQFTSKVGDIIQENFIMKQRLEQLGGRLEETKPANGSSLPHQSVLMSTKPVLKLRHVPRVTANDSFFVDKNIDKTMAHYSVLCEMQKQRLSTDDDISDFGQYVKEKGFLWDYIRYLQEKTVECLPVHKKLMNHFVESWNAFLLRPDLNMLEDKRQQINERYEIDEHIVGSVHVLPYKFDDTVEFYVCLAIINSVIICWSAKQTKELAMENLYVLLDQSLKWSPDFKFVTSLPITREMENLFVHADFEDMFDGNERVTLWMTTNFPALSTTIFGRHIAAIPAFYNMAVSFNALLSQLARRVLKVPDEFPHDSPPVSSKL